MSTSIIAKLKDFSSRQRLSEPRGKIIFVERDQKSVNCPNHFVEYMGITKPRKQLLVFGNMTELTCDCGIIYKKE